MPNREIRETSGSGDWEKLFSDEREDRVMILSRKRPFQRDRLKGNVSR